MSQGHISKRIVNPPGGAGVTDHGALTGLTPDDDHPHYALADGSRGTFEAAGAVATHAAAGDPHTGYQKESEKGAANGYASLNGSTVVRSGQLGTGSGGATKFLREDSTFQTVSGGGAHASTHQAGGGDTLQVQLAEPTAVTGVLDETNGGTGQATITKGDLLAGSAANTLGKLAVGATTGMPLVADGGAALGVKWDDVHFTRINGSSGAAGQYVTWQKLSANAAANATTALATVMTTTGVGAGTWSFKYKVRYQSSATGTGVALVVNHTGTTGAFVASWWMVSTGAAAATGVADQVSAIVTGQMVEGKSERVKNTASSASAGVDTINADMLAVIEGFIVVTVSGSLELRHASETANSTQVMADTLLELNKVG